MAFKEHYLQQVEAARTRGTQPQWEAPLMSIMDATPGGSPLDCASCHRSETIACCYCDVDLCEACTPRHLALCYFAKTRTFRTWRPAIPIRWAP